MEQETHITSNKYFIRCQHFKIYVHCLLQFLQQPYMIGIINVLFEVLQMSKLRLKEVKKKNDNKLAALYITKQLKVAQK